MCGCFFVVRINMIEINEATLASLLQLAGQYMFPAAALLRALYSGYRGRLPEGFGQIAAASVFAGMTAIADQQQPDLTSIIGELAGNTVFMAGLLSFIVVYLLRIPYFGLIADIIVGAVLAVIGWALWAYVLGNGALPLGTIAADLLGSGVTPALQSVLNAAALPVVAVAGSIIFVVLRFSMRQIGRLLRIASVFITLGVLFLLGAGALYFADQAGLV